MFNYHFLELSLQDAKKKHTFIKVPDNIIIFVSKDNYTEKQKTSVIKKLTNVRTDDPSKIYSILKDNFDMYDAVVPNYHIYDNNHKTFRLMLKHIRNINDKLNIYIIFKQPITKNMKGGNDIIFPSRYVVNGVFNEYDPNIKFTISNLQILLDDNVISGIEYIPNDTQRYELLKIPNILIDENKKEQPLLLTNNHIALLLGINPSFFSPQLGININNLWTVTKEMSNSIPSRARNTTQRNIPNSSLLLYLSDLNEDKNNEIGWSIGTSSYGENDDEQISIMPSHLVLRVNLTSQSAIAFKNTINLIENAFIKTIDKRQLPTNNTGHYIEFVISRRDLSLNITNSRAKYTEPQQGGIGNWLSNWFPKKSQNTSKQNIKLNSKNVIDDSFSLDLDVKTVRYIEEEDRIVEDIENHNDNQLRNIVVIKYLQKINDFKLKANIYLTKLIIAEHDGYQDILETNDILFERKTLSAKEKDKTINTNVFFIDLLNKKNDKIAKKLILRGSSFNSNDMFTFDLKQQTYDGQL